MFTAFLSATAYPNSLSSPFTIQRICELIWKPREHYKHSGKYLHALERTLLVASTALKFPVIPPEDKDAMDITFSPAGSLREARTPLFSPIPFLHEDARSRSRSRSRSPPMSPLQLATTALAATPDELRLGDGVTDSGEPIIDGPVIGLVDELDDPGPGHMSERPTALTAVTSTAPEAAENTEESERGSSNEDAEGAKAPLIGSLEERFVKAEEATSGKQTDAPMAVEEPDEDKENVPKP